jgi:hypothetical protein
MLFLDLIARAIGQRGAQNYIYISMGATFLHDHHTVYRRIGIENLVSFDRNGEGVKRQKFNRPTDKMTCLEMDSADLPDRLDEIRGKRNAIVWLDYMSPKDRRLQLQQCAEVLRILQPGDLLRLTINADYRSFGKFDDAAKKKFPNAQAMAASKLKAQIEEFLPADFETLKSHEVPDVLSRAVGLAAASALRHRDDIKIVPVLSTSYADGAPMVTVTCAVRSIEERRLPDSLNSWRHRSKDWDKLIRIDVPDLSMREKQHIDRRITFSSTKILRSLPFRPDDADATLELKRAIDSYKSLHRYYPAFHNIDY